MSARLIKGFRHIGIVVQDLDSAMSFWVQTLGFEVIIDSKENTEFIDTMMGLSDSELRTVKLGIQEHCIVELLNFSSHSDLNKWNGSPWSTGITHIAFNVEDIDSLTKKICNAGGRLLGPVQLSVDKRVRVAYVESPDGVLLELVEPRIEAQP